MFALLARRREHVAAVVNFLTTPTPLNNPRAAAPFSADRMASPVSE